MTVVVVVGGVVGVPTSSTSTTPSAIIIPFFGVVVHVEYVHSTTVMNWFVAAVDSSPKPARTAVLHSFSLSQSQFGSTLLFRHFPNNPTQQQQQPTICCYDCPFLWLFSLVQPPPSPPLQQEQQEAIIWHTHKNPPPIH